MSVIAAATSCWPFSNISSLARSATGEVFLPVVLRECPEWSERAPYPEGSMSPPPEKKISMKAPNC